VTSTPVEVELKYAVRDREVIEHLLDSDRLGELVVGPWSTVEVLDRYVDTADLRLETEGWNARLRTTEDRTSLDLKSLDDVAVEPESNRRPQSGSLRRRIEWSGPATTSLDPTDWPESAARARLAALAGDAPIEERFSLRQTRRERELRGTSGWAILSLDDVVVEHGGRSVGRFGALEIEMRGGDDHLLDVVAEMLEGSGPSSREPASMSLRPTRRRSSSPRPPRPTTSSSSPTTSSWSPARRPTRSASGEAPRAPRI
jgi:inorganic triphosphatase YgiF